MRAAVTFALLLLLSSAAFGQRKDSKHAYAPPGRMVDVGGYRLHLNCTGAGGPAVVLIAGGGDFSFDWGLVQPDASRFARVCSYDRAGLAWSDPGPVPRTMRQEAFELHTLLKAARVKAPYVLVGHSVGGLIARVYAQQYPNEVAGVVLVDPTHEDTTLFYQGKAVRVREGAKGVSVPPVQTLRASPPRPPAPADVEQFEFNQKMFGAPKTEPPFDKLPPRTQAMRLWFRSRPPRAAEAPDFWAEELQAIYAARAEKPRQFGDKPLVLLLPGAGAGGPPPPGISADEWKRISDEKREQKLGLTSLSRDSRLVVAGKSGHHIQLDEPRVVTGAIRMVVDAVRRRAKLSP